MPKITNFAFCEPGQFEKEGPGLNFVDTVETSSDIFKLAVVYSITDFSAFQNHTGFLKLKGPDNQVIIETDPFEVEKANEEDPSLNGSNNIVSGITMGMEFGNVQFKGPGLYKVEVFFDNTFLSDFYIPVLFEKESVEE